MASENIAVLGCTINHSTGSIVSGGAFVISSTPSTVLKAEGKGAYSQAITFTFTGGTISGGTPATAAGSGTITATAETTKTGSLPVMRLGDSGTITGTYTVPGTPPVITPFSDSVEITDAGQTKVKAV